MLANGHPDCRRYPIALLRDEAGFVRERENARIVTEAQLIRSAVWGLLSKKGGESFQKHINSLNLIVKPARYKEVEKSNEEGR